MQWLSSYNPLLFVFLTRFYLSFILHRFFDVTTLVLVSENVEKWGTGCIGWEENAFSGKQIPKAASPMYIVSPNNT